jgi:hypothetical protein
MSVKLLFTAVLFATLALGKTVELSPESLSTSTLKLGFDKTIKLNANNRFRFLINIDSNNRCVITSLTPTVKKEIFIPRNSEWKSEMNALWNDWDSKSYSFKLVHARGSILMKCELNLDGEVLLFNAKTEKKASASCAKRGGKVRNEPPSYSVQHPASRRFPASLQKYCVKQIPKITFARLTNAFRNAKIKINFEFQTEDL